MDLLQEIKNELFVQKQLRVCVLRLDLIHPLTGGNKHFKLKYNLQKAKSLGLDTVLSFGGAYSNHIAALACAAKQNGLSSIGVIRGDELDADSNETLRTAKQNGMQLFFVDRQTYRLRSETNFHKQLKEKFGDVFIVPEGGSNSLAVKGCMEIKDYINVPFDCVMAACGTGGTIAGISLSLNVNQKAIGIPVLKGAEFLLSDIQKLQEEALNEFNLEVDIKQPELFFDYHFGGYAKSNEDLTLFHAEFETEYGILLDKIYTSKLFYALFDLVKRDQFEKGKTIVVVHSGGLQGN